MTSVDLITAETVSPTFSFISSALRFVITLSIKFLARADDNVSHDAAELNFYNFTLETVPR
jgi:hypothetical protein